MTLQMKDGWIEAIVGPMFSGKTEELIKRLTAIKYAKKNFICFKPTIDNRWKNKNEIHSRSGAILEAIPIKSPNEIYKYIENENYFAVAFDESQFFDDTLLDVIVDLANKQIRVIVAGLELDINRNIFGPMAQVLTMAEFVTKLKAVCFVCGNQASFTYKIKGDPNKIIQIGDKEYEARCRRDFEPYN